MQTNNHLTLNYEIVDENSYEFYPLGEYIVMAPAICDGEPTFKYTRINVTVILSMLRAGYSIDELVKGYDSPYLTHDAIREAISLADSAFTHQTQQQFIAAVAA